jgi:UDP-hydrolysing UDP-N-acetyl-D-glucosamine 2-epimerase
MPKPNIAIVTGTRAEYGIWRPVLRAIQHSKKLNLQLVVTGMHLQTQFGYSINYIEDDAFPIAAKIKMYDRSTVRSTAFRLLSPPPESPAQALARGIAGLAAAFAKLKPDLVMVLGDRLEILAAANAALTERIPLAHVHGGEIAPGIWDEQIRHAVTKIAHLHFCATKTAAKRIAQMGEVPAGIHLVGAPALDLALPFIAQNRKSQPSIESLEFPRHAAIVVLHPSSPDDRLEEHRTRLLIRALENQKIPFEAIAPNNDPGHVGILRAYEALHVPVILSLPQEKFWTLLRRTAENGGLLIGNSSSGILEAATLAIPVINLGDRQKGRERNPNVLDLPWPNSPKPIENAIQYVLTNKPFLRLIAKRQNLYGDGRAAPRILKILESLKFPLSTAKQFHNH